MIKEIMQKLPYIIQQNNYGNGIQMYLWMVLIDYTVCLVFFLIVLMIIYFAHRVFFFILNLCLIYNFSICRPIAPGFQAIRNRKSSPPLSPDG